MTNPYPKIMIKKSTLLMVVLFTEPNIGTIVDNLKGNIKGYTGNFPEEEFIPIEEVLMNDEVRGVLH